MRPSGSTAVASMVSIPAPDSAIEPRWIMCQACACPSTAEYWHIGEITMRLRKVSPRNVIGEKSALIREPRIGGAGGKTSAGRVGNYARCRGTERASANSVFRACPPHTELIGPCGRGCLPRHLGRGLYIAG